MGTLEHYERLVAEAEAQAERDDSLARPVRFVVLCHEESRTLADGTHRCCTLLYDHSGEHQDASDVAATGAVWVWS
jgi:hypothetical protein